MEETRWISSINRANSFVDMSTDVGLPRAPEKLKGINIAVNRAGTKESVWLVRVCLRGERVAGQLWDMYLC